MRTHAARHSLAALLALAVVASAGPGRAQDFYAPPALSTLFDTSIRAAAMGGAGTAVMWGEPGVWANPATLSGVNGIGWVAGYTHVLPGLAEDVTFNSQRLLIGGGGLGFSFMGQPISGLGKAKFDLGTTTVFTPFGSNTFSAYDQTEGWGVGLSPLRLVESIRKLVHASPHSLTSYGDVAFGYQGKASKAVVDPGFKLDEAGTYDWGASGRLALGRFWGADAPFRLDLSGAYAQLNVIKPDEKNSGDAAQQVDRFGAALHLSPPPPSERSSSPPSLPWWRPGDVPEISAGLAYDHEHRHDEPFAGDSYDVDHYGLEANVFRLLSVRVGYVYDREGQIKGWTYGGGLSVPIGPWGSVGYQLASVPLAPDVDRQFRQGFSVWLDPTRFWSGNR
jgi:hypothetical protein